MKIEFITPSIACGCLLQTPKDMEKIISKGITHILGVGPDCDIQLWWGSGLKYKYPMMNFFHLYLSDDKEDRLDYVWKVIFEYCEGVLKNKNNKLYIHCTLGESRSPSIIYFLLRTLLKLSPEKAKQVITNSYYKKIANKILNVQGYISYVSGIEQTMEKWRG